MSTFFLPSKGSSKGKKGKKSKVIKKTKGEKVQKVSRKSVGLNEEIASDSEAENETENKHPRNVFGRDSDSDEELRESAPEKRLRLAKEYLTRLETAERERKEGDDVHRDAIAHRLRDDALEQAGKLQKKVTDQYIAPDKDSIRILRGHQLSVTCVVMTPDDKYIYSGSKDCCIIKWDFETGKKVVIFSGHRKGIEGVVGHTGHVLALAVSSDGKFMASGGQDKIIHVWDTQTNLHLHTFRGHKDSITGLAFQKGTHELFSCSYDRTVKIWNLDEMAYVETLFGHQDEVSSIDCLQRERPVTAGTNDRTLRIWKVLEESQLVFNGHKASIDSVRLINEEHMISGSQDGTVALWSIMKKKPLVTQRHHIPQEESMTEDLTKEHWVTSVASYPNTDMVASGSNDGMVCIWKCGDDFRSLDPLFLIPLSGFINDLAFANGGSYLIAGIGQEHRFGRWWKERTCKNSLAIIPLCRK